MQSVQWNNGKGRDFSHYDFILFFSWKLKVNYYRIILNSKIYNKLFFQKNFFFLSDKIGFYYYCSSIFEKFSNMELIEINFNLDILDKIIQHKFS